jgi:glycosyltransferase involved in cell wall biosynthesis
MSKEIAFVSIGMPVYNAEKFVREAIQSLLQQTHRNFELIISDNASTDMTESICREYAVKDKRIRYVRQPQNFGAGHNFKFVFDEACGEYFMWAAGDDVFSKNFVEINQKFLSENPDYVASTCPTGFDVGPLDQQKLVDFALDGNVLERFTEFFENSNNSHGIFYSLMRTDVLRGCEVVGQAFFAWDWVLDLYLALHGKVHRSSEGYTIFGVDGMSRGPDAHRLARTHPIEVIFPFYTFTRHIIKMITGLSLKQKVRIFYLLVKLNIKGAIDTVYGHIYFMYKKLT